MIVTAAGRPATPVSLFLPLPGTVKLEWSVPLSVSCGTMLRDEERRVTAWVSAPQLVTRC
jgi:hypothetical protein